MKGLAAVVRDVLTPRIGESLADMTVRATAISLGKTAEDLTSRDLEPLLERSRTMMAGVATQAHIDACCDEIRTRALTEGVA